MADTAARPSRRRRGPPSTELAFPASDARDRVRREDRRSRRRPDRHRRPRDLPREGDRHLRVRARPTDRAHDPRGQGRPLRDEVRGLMSSARPRVLILGGGFAGVGTAHRLKDADAEVVLVDRHDYHTFQPLLYQLATGLLETTAVGHSLRDLVARQENTTVHQATVTAVDLDKREVRFDELEPMSYDYLVFGLGAEVNFFGTEGAADHAFPMYTLPHAVRLKEHLLERWEAADHEPAIVDDGALNIVVVGGGPTGVETAGAIAELYRADFARDYPALRQDHARVILVEAGPELFAMFKPKLREYATKALADRTVEVMTGAMVASVSPTRVRLKSGKELEAHTLVWGAGLQGNRVV